MKTILKTSAYLLVAILVGVTAVYATSKLTPPGTVTNTMYSLTDIYNLASGTTATEGSGAIATTPGTITETGKTLTEVYTAISTEIAKLSSSVIASGTSVFGVTGAGTISLGDATASNVLAGKYFSNAITSNLLGTMTNKVGTNTVITPSTADQTIAQGYYGGVSSDGKVLGDTDLIASNIKSGINIFGVVGNVSAGYAYPSRPLKTGKTGENQRGVTRSYTLNIIGEDAFTITDNSTGLMWQHCSAGLVLVGGNCTGTTTQLAFDGGEASDYCENLSLGGYSDWHLPNINELQSIIDYGFYGLTINAIFNGTAEIYWSADLDENAPMSALFVNFNDGHINSGYYGDAHSVRCVRENNL